MYNVGAGEENSYSESLESKYTVADILSSMANSGGEPPISFSSVTTPDFTTLSSTHATDTLTPTTIASLEQSFIELQSMAPCSTQSGYMAPTGAPVTIKSEYPDWNDPEWMPPSAKRGRYNAPGMSSLVQSATNYASPYSPTLSVVSSSSSCNSMPGTQRRLPGPRRHYKDEKLSPAETDRRKIRRERNKLAAAKCRQRRVDQTNTLVNETECLEDEQCDLKNELQRLQREKDELEFVLQAHKPRCVRKHNLASACRDSSAVKREKTHTDVDSACTLDLSVTMAMKQPATSRPTSLAIPSRTSAANMTDALGVPLTTPSSGLFTFGLESMVDGHTGLTPITGAPSCATQAQRSSSDSNTTDVMSSPTSLMAL